MRAVLQRVKSAKVTVDGDLVGSISGGVLALIGVERGDELADAVTLAGKMADLRLFEDAEGRMNLDTAQVGGAFLVVSQFTLAASLAKGRRPSFNRAAKPEHARPLVEVVMSELVGRGFDVAGGRFGAQMEVELTNDGPVTLILEVREGRVI